jgi:serine/threonine protein kinase
MSMAGLPDAEEHLQKFLAWVKRSCAERLHNAFLHGGAGLEYLHTAGIMHCDLKPANVLLKSTAANRRGFTCKLCDFGMSRLLDVQQATHVSTQTYGVRPPAEHCLLTSYRNRLLFLAEVLQVQE